MPSDAAQRLAQTRLALVEYAHRRERRRHPSDESTEAWPGEESHREEPPPPPGSGWLGRIQYAVRMWWRYHPAQMGVEIATPVLQAYARKKPVQLLAISAGVGATVMLLRPWRLISLTTVVVAILKSSQLSNLVLSALSAADFERDHQRPE
jgi:hypothetical protein